MLEAQCKLIKFPPLKSTVQAAAACRAGRSGRQPVPAAQPGEQELHRAGDGRVAAMLQRGREVLSAPQTPLLQGGLTGRSHRERRDPTTRTGLSGRLSTAVPPARSGDATGTGSGGAGGILCCAGGGLPACCVCWAPAGVLLSTSGTFPWVKKGTSCWPTAAYTRVAAASPCTPQAPGGKGHEAISTLDSFQAPHGKEKLQTRPQQPQNLKV